MPKAVLTPQDIRIAPGLVAAGSKERRGGSGHISVSGSSGTSPTATTLTAAMITAISSLTFSATPTQAECNALRDNVVTALNAVLADLGNRESDVASIVTDLSTGIEGTLEIMEDPYGPEFPLIP